MLFNEPPQHNYSRYRDLFEKDIKRIEQQDSLEYLFSHKAYLDFHRFAYIHLATGDLDPIYSMIRYSDLSEDQKMKLMFSHLMVYDLESSVYLAGIPDHKYYDAVWELFETGKVGKDRKDVAIRETRPNSRSFNTQIEKMRHRSPVEWMKRAEEYTLQFKTWGESVKGGQFIPTFGEYFGFKTADMLETIFDHDYSIGWTECFRKTIPRGSLTGYETVRTNKTHGFRKAKEVKSDPEQQTFYLNEVEYFSEFVCPHKPTRKMNVQEVETLLCDYRKYRKGTLKHGSKVQKLSAISSADNEYTRGLKHISEYMISHKDYVMEHVNVVDRDFALDSVGILLEY